MAAPDEPPVAWPDHPLAASGGEILATRILPLMGHNARDFARAAAVCRGWRAACRAATATLSLYRETDLQSSENVPDADDFVWSPCAKFIAAVVCRPPRLLIWRAATGALVNEWALDTPSTDVPPAILQNSGCNGITVTFSRDSTRALTLFRYSDHFAVWSVPDGQLLAVNRGDPNGFGYDCADFGVPGSASDGLVGLCSRNSTADLWDVSPPPEGGPSWPRLRSRVDLAPGENGRYSGSSFAFSKTGSEFVAACLRATYVYDVASLTRLGAYTSPSSFLSGAAWAPDGRHVLVSWDASACVWDFSRPGAPPVVSADVGPESRFHSWSPRGDSYFISQENDGGMYLPYCELEERRAANGSLVRAVTQGPWSGCAPSISPDSHALLVFPFWGNPARIVVFD